MIGLIGYNIYDTYMVKPTDITNAYIQTVGSGDIASGTVVLIYNADNNEKVYNIKYDTVGSPDGLKTIITDSVGDSIRLDDGQYEKAPEFVIKQAKQTLSNYYHEANKGKNAVSEGRITYSGIVGVNDNWLPEKI